MPISDPKCVTLPPYWQELARAEGMRRYSRARKRGYEDMQVGDQDKAFIDINGAAGEIAVALLFQLMVAPILSPEAGANDLYLPDGTGIDVKTCDRPQARLLASPWKKEGKQAFLYALVTGDFRESWEYSWRGFALADELFRPENLKDFGRGPTYALDQKYLHQNLFEYEQHCTINV